MRVHLEGMGVVGSGVAWHLAAQGADVTWSDTHPTTWAAWPASTGCAYPSGDALAEVCRKVWAGWARFGGPWDTKVDNSFITERAAFWYDTKLPPHGGPGPHVRETRGLRLSPELSVHVNVPWFVHETRRKFRELVEGPGRDRRLIRCHSAPVRWTWGWSGTVGLNWPYGHPFGEGERRPCFYLRRHRFETHYAYPVPGNPTLWFAGSATIRQSTPAVKKVTDIRRLFAEWTQHVHTVTGATVDLRTFSQGWRPVGAEEPLALARKNKLWSRDKDGALRVAPLSHSGVRLLPEVLRQLGLALTEDA